MAALVVPGSSVSHPVPALSLAFLLVGAECRQRFQLFWLFFAESRFSCRFLMIFLTFKFISSHLLLPLLQSSLIAQLEPVCTSPRLNELSHCRLDRQPAPAPTLLSLTSCLQQPLVHAAVWSALPWCLCGQSEASHAASCVLFPEGS